MEHGGVLVKRTQLLDVLECGGDAGVAGGGIGIASAEHQAIGDVRCRPHSPQSPWRRGMVTLVERLVDIGAQDWHGRCCWLCSCRWWSCILDK